MQDLRKKNVLDGNAGVGLFLVLFMLVFPSCFNKHAPVVKKTVSRRRVRRTKKNSAASNAVKSMKWLKRGKEFMDDADYQAARLSFAEALRADPNSTAAVEGLLRSGRLRTLWATKLGEAVRSPKIESVRLLPSEETFLAAGDGAWYEIDCFSGKVLRTVQTPEKLAAIDVSPDGVLVAAAGRPNSDTSGGRIIAVYDRLLGMKKAEIRDDRPIHALRFTPDGKFVLLGAEKLPRGRGDHIRMYRASDGRLSWAGNVTAKMPFAWDTAFEPTGKFFYAQDPYKLDLAKYSVKRGRRLSSWKDKLPSQVVSLALSGDLSKLASIHLDGTLCTWEMSTRRRLRCGRIEDAGVLCGAWLGRDGLFAAGLDNGEAVIFDPVTGKVICRFRGHKAPVTGIAALSGGKSVISADRDGYLYSWTVFTGENFRRLPVRTAGESGAAVPVHEYTSFSVIAASPPGNLLAVAPNASLSATAVIVMRPDGGSARILPPPEAGTHAAALDFSPDGRFLAVGFSNGRLSIYNTGDLQRIAGATVPAGAGGEDCIRKVKFYDNGARVVAAVGNPDNPEASPVPGLLQMDINLSGTRFVPAPENLQTVDVAFFKNRQAFYVCGIAPKTGLMKTWSCLWDFSNPQAEPEALGLMGLSPRGHSVVYFGQKTRKSMDIEQLTTAWEQRGNSPLSSPEFSPDGRFIAVQSKKGLEIIDSGTGRLVCTLPASADGRFLDFAWLNNGLKLVACGSEIGVVLYDLYPLLLNGSNNSRLAQAETLLEFRGGELVDLSAGEAKKTGDSVRIPKEKKSVIQAMDAGDARIILAEARRYAAYLEAGINRRSAFRTASALYGKAVSRDRKLAGVEAGVFERNHGLEHPGAPSAEELEKYVSKFTLGVEKRYAPEAVIEGLEKFLSASREKAGDKQERLIEIIKSLERNLPQQLAAVMGTGPGGRVARNPGEDWLVTSGRWRRTMGGTLTGACRPGEIAAATLLKPLPVGTKISVTVRFESSFTLGFGSGLQRPETGGYAVKLSRNKLVFSRAGNIIKSAAADIEPGRKITLALERLKGGFFCYLGDSIEPVLYYRDDSPLSGYEQNRLGIAAFDGGVTILEINQRSSDR